MTNISQYFSFSAAVVFLPRIMYFKDTIANAMGGEQNKLDVLELYVKGHSRIVTVAVHI